MTATLFAKGKMGIDGNRPIDSSSGAIAAQVSDPTIIANTGAAFVRINFVLGPWSSPDDSTIHAGRTWFQVYDKIIDDFLDQGVEVYGLIGSEATSRPDPGRPFPRRIARPGRRGLVAGICQQLRGIVAHFAGRVDVYESFNEPNDWHGGSSNWIHSYWFAKMLRVIYKTVKIDNGHNVTLVSGGGGGGGGRCSPTICPPAGTMAPTIWIAPIFLDAPATPGRHSRTIMGRILWMRSDTISTWRRKPSPRRRTSRQFTTSI